VELQFIVDPRALAFQKLFSCERASAMASEVTVLSFIFDGARKFNPAEVGFCP
jgi:hypothetical protein